MMKKLLLLPVFLMIFQLGFSVTGYFQFDKMNGTLLSLDNFGVANIPIRLNCSINNTVYIDKKLTNITVSTIFNTTTNNLGRYNFTGQGAYFSDLYGQTTVNCVLSSTNINVSNPNTPYTFRIISGYYSLGATYNLTYNTLVTAPTISLVYPLSTVGSSDTVIVAMNYAQSCFINGSEAARIGTSNQFQRTMTFINGLNRLTARCLDVSGVNRTAIIDVIADTVGPSISLVNPTSVIGTSSTTLIVSATDASPISSCTANGLPMTDIGGNQFSRPVTGLINGDNSFDIVCVDSFSNSGSQAVIINADLNAPVINIISPTATTYTSQTITVNLGVSDDNLDEVWYNWNGTDYYYTAPVDLIFNLGSNTLNVYANDSFNRLSYDSVTFDVSPLADTTAPSLTINSPINTTYATQDISVDLTAIDNVLVDQVWYNWNGINISYSSPVIISFNSGVNTLYAWANDSSGNINATSVVFTVNLDTTAPSLTINSPINTTYDYQNINVNLAANDPNLDNVWYNWNGANITYTGATSITFDIGVNTLYAWANDTFGNTNFTSVVFTVSPITDEQAPNLEIISPLNITYDYQNIMLNLSANDSNLDRVWYNYNGVNITYLGANNITFDAGVNTLYAWANDTFGNINTTSVVFTVNPDLTAPSLEIVSPLNITYDYQNIMLNLSAVDPNLDSVWYNYDGANITYLGANNITFDIGVNTLYAWANDSLGNTNYTNVTFTVSPITDNQAPSLEIISPLNITYDYFNITVELFASDPNLENIWYNWNGTNISYSSPVNITFNAGVNTLYAWANDTFGNINSTSVVFTLNETVAPSLEIVSPINTTYTNPLINLILLFSDLNLDRVWYNWNGVNITYTSPIQILFNEGLNWLQAWAIDLFGNLNYTSVYFTVDSHIPQIDIIVPLNGVTYEDEILDLRVQTDVAVESCWFNESSILNTTMIMQSSTEYYYPLMLEDGDYYYTFYCNNSLGVVGSNSTNFTILVNTEAPLEMTIISPLTDYYNYYPPMNVSVNKLVDNCTYSLNGAANITMDALSLNNYGAIAASGFIEEDINSADFYCQTIEELAHDSVVFYVDTIAPRVSFDPISMINASPFNLTGSFTDPSGMYGVTYYYNNIEIGVNYFEPYNYLWNVPLSIENSYVNLSLIASDAAQNLNSSVLFNVPVNAVNDAPIAILEFNGSYGSSVKLLNATSSHDPDYEFDGVGVNLTYQLSPNNSTYYNINDSSCTNITGVCEWNILETVSVCPIDAVCYLRALVNDDAHFVSSNVVAFYDNAPKDLTVLSMTLPAEPIAGQQYNASIEVLNKGSFDVFSATANYYDNNELVYSEIFDMLIGEQKNLTFENVNFTKGVHNITIMLEVFNEITPVDNSLTSFVTAENLIDKMIISAMAPDKVMANSNIEATIFAYNTLMNDYLLDNDPYSDFSASFTPANYSGLSLLNDSLIYFSYNFNVPGTQGLYNFWANSSLQEEGAQASSNVEEINVTIPNSPIMSVDLIVMPKISNLWNSLVIAQVYNYGNETGLNTNATIVLPSGVNLVSPNPTLYLGDIVNGTYKQINWTVRGDYFGDFNIGVLVETENYEDVGENVALEKPIIAHKISYDSVIDTAELLTVKVLLNNTGANADNVNISLMLSDNLSSTELFKMVNLPNNTLNYEAEFNVSCSLATVNNKTFKVAVKEVTSNYYEESLVSFTKRVDPVLHTIVTLAASASSNNVILNWNAVSEAVRYLVYKSASSSGPFTNIANTTANNYQDSAVTYDVTHYYRVVAMNIEGQLGMDSNVASILIPTPTTPPPYVPPSGGGGGIYFPPDNGGGALPEDNDSSNNTTTNTSVVNDAVLKQKVANLTKSLSLIGEFEELLTMEQKLSIELINNDLLKAELNASKNQTYYLSALNAFKLYFDKYEVINETINAVSMVENFKVDSTINKIRVKLSIDSAVDKYLIIRNITNNGTETLNSLTLGFDLPIDAIIKTSKGIIVEGSKALASIESLNPGESLTVEYSFITKNDYAEYLALVESAPAIINPLTGLITLIESNADLIIYSTAGLAIVIFGLFAYLKRSALSSAFGKASSKINNKKVEVLQGMVRKLNRMLKSSEKKK